MEENCITLPLIPKDYAYEDYVSSVLNAGGYYLERNIHKREKSDILELDIVTNKFTDRCVEKTIAEIKSGNWGFPDIFKVRGWMDYLQFSKASFVVQKADSNQEVYNEIANQLDISLVVTEMKGKKLCYNQIQNAYAIKHTPHENAFVANLRFSYALERKIISDINTTAKTNKNLVGFEKLRNYLYDLCDNTFFVSTPSARINKTFKLFTENKHITARLDHENAENSYASISDTGVDITQESFKKLFYDHDSKNKLYGSLYVEMLNRLLVLKHCIEDLLRPENEQEIANYISDLNHAILPVNLKAAIGVLKSHNYYYLYPYFWQVFIFLFGGFILENKRQEEYNLLSEISEVPVEEIGNALSVFDLLFPIEGGWMQKVNKTSMKILKFMPSPFCGIGVNLRKDIYCKEKTLEGLKALFPPDYTYNDLIRYNNLAYEYLLKSDDVVRPENKYKY